jgi:hypothetical protein
VILSFFLVPTRVPPNLGAFLNGANGTQENLSRAATAQAQAAQPSAQRPSSSAGPAISPPSTGDAGLISASRMAKTLDDSSWRLLMPAEQAKELNH